MGHVLSTQSSERRESTSPFSHQEGTRGCPLFVRPTGATLICLQDSSVGCSAQKLLGFIGCSRICSGQSIQELQGSTEFGMYTVSRSIISTYSQPISTGFHKRSDLFWDRWSHLFNYLKINGLQNYLHRVSTESSWCFEVVQVVRPVFVFS